jgi:hypothetical protein
VIQSLLHLLAAFRADSGKNPRYLVMSPRDLRTLEREACWPQKPGITMDTFMGATVVQRPTVAPPHFALFNG